MITIIMSIKYILDIIYKYQHNKFCPFLDPMRTPNVVPLMLKLITYVNLF